VIRGDATGLALADSALSEPENPRLVAATLRFAAADPFRLRAGSALLGAPLSDIEDEKRFGCHVIAGLPVDPAFIANAKPAAVLYPVVARPEGLSVLLTERAGHLSSHAGQVAFPGGRIEPGESAGEAALREANEEIGLRPEDAEVLGYLPPYFSGTGFRVQPVVALIDPAAVLRPAPSEVARIFEVPLDHAMNLAHYRQSTIFWRGKERIFYILDHEAAYIWGVTAGILRAFAERY
jgi:8-oxo-dGTP pyrophosphatase MutT (NUDIX family)